MSKCVCVCVCQPLFQRGPRSSMYMCLYTHFTGRGAVSIDEAAAQRRHLIFAVIWSEDAQSTYLLRPLRAYWPTIHTGGCRSNFSGKIYLLSSLQSSHGCFYASIKCVIGGRIPKATRWHGSGCLASRGIVILQTGSVSADAHFLPCFSRLILGLAFLSCFPVMPFHDRREIAFAMRFCSRLTVLLEERNQTSPRWRFLSSCVVATLAWPLGGPLVLCL